MANDVEGPDAAVPRSLPPARIRVRRLHSSAEVAPEIHHASETPVEDYQVGYCKPPRLHQFQPGRSGNPKGRPKGSRSLSLIFLDELDKPISAQIRGRTVTMSRREALAQRFIEQALKGDPRAMAMLMKVDGAGAAANNSASAEGQALSLEEEILLRAHLAKLGLEDGQ